MWVSMKRWGSQRLNARTSARVSGASSLTKSRFKSRSAAFLLARCCLSGLTSPVVEVSDTGDRLQRLPGGFVNGDAIGDRMVSRAQVLWRLDHLPNQDRQRLRRKLPCVDISDSVASLSLPDRVASCGVEIGGSATIIRGMDLPSPVLPSSVRWTSFDFSARRLQSSTTSAYRAVALNPLFSATVRRLSSAPKAGAKSPKAASKVAMCMEQSLGQGRGPADEVSQDGRRREALSIEGSVAVGSPLMFHSDAD